MPSPFPTDDDRRSGTGGPFADTDARRLFTAHVISYAGSTLTTFVLPVLAYELTGSPAHAATVVALALVPYLALGLPVSAWADRSDRRSLMIGAEVVSAGLAVSLPAASAAGVLTVGHVYAVGLGLGVAFVVFDAANFGALPAIAGTHLSHVLTRQWTVDATLQLTGPVVAGLVLAAAGASTVLVIDAVTFATSAVVLAGIRRSFRTEVSTAAPAAGTETVKHRVLAGWAFIRAQPVVRSLTLLGIGNSLTAGAVTALLVPHAVHRLGLTTDDPRLGVLYGAGALGGLVATRVHARLRDRHPPGRITIGALGATTVAVVAFALMPTFPAACVAYVVVVTGSQVTILNGITHRQRVTPDALQGRVNVLARMIAVAGQPIGALAAGAIAERVPTPAVLAGAAVGTAVAFLLARRGPLAGQAAAGTPVTARR